MRKTRRAAAVVRQSRSRSRLHNNVLSSYYAWRPKKRARCTRPAITSRLGFGVSRRSFGAGTATRGRYRAATKMLNEWLSSVLPKPLFHSVALGNGTPGYGLSDARTEPHKTAHLFGLCTRTHTHTNIPSKEGNVRVCAAGRGVGRGGKRSGAGWGQEPPRAFVRKTPNN